ncbi:hypothetical protein [Aurantiacibacter spongiae]|uniref:hypothetical protein n=1 Tax=Aurantiacibacter spongiae TaxID=2488860 RepID=UPI000F506C9B|nr:hypothetical protein [Aurantiacibacter spongiae]
MDRATHTDYLHPGHLRVETGQHYQAWAAGSGSFVRTALCVSPSSSTYKRLNRRGLPKWCCGKIVNGVEVPCDCVLEDGR